MFKKQQPRVIENPDKRYCIVQNPLDKRYAIYDKNTDNYYDIKSPRNLWWSLLDVYVIDCWTEDKDSLIGVLNNLNTQGYPFTFVQESVVDKQLDDSVITVVEDVKVLTDEQLVGYKDFFPTWTEEERESLFQALLVYK